MLYLAYTSETATVDGEDTYVINNVIGIFSTVENARDAVAAYYRKQSVIMSQLFDCEGVYTVGDWGLYVGLVGGDSRCAMVDYTHDGETEHECEMADIIPLGDVDNPAAPVHVLNIY